MFLRIKNNLYRKKYFWQLKRLLENSIIFGFWRQIFQLRVRFQDEKISAELLRASFPPILLNIIYAIIFVLSIETFNYLSQFNLPVDLDEETLTVFLSTIVTICGVFLGLYFTAVSAVAGNLFMRASEDLQALFIREKNGQQYVKTLVLTSVIGILYLLLKFFGYTIHPLGPILMAILAAYGVIRFMLLGSRLFYFVHPVEASVTITKDAIRAINNASVKGFRWKKSNFQNHYRIQADHALSTMRSLIDFGVEVIKFSDQQLVNITQFVSGMLQYYVRQKKSIPSDSLWFRTKPQFKNWMLADSTEIILALNTGTSLTPKYIKDQTWFEEECIETILKPLSLCMNNQNWGAAQSCLESLVTAAERFGENFYEDSSRLITQKAGTIMKNAAPPNNMKIYEENERIAFFDSSGRLPISILVGFNQYLHGHSAAELARDIRKIHWLSSNNIYKSALPGALLSTLESTAKNVRNEYTIEGKIVSPEWYLITISVQQCLFELKKYFDFIKTLHTDYFLKNVEKLNSDNQILLSANLIQRWLEFLNKFAVCINMFEKFVTDCEVFRKVKDLPWVSIDFDVERNSIEQWHKEVENNLVGLLPALAEFTQKRKSESPDYFGQAYVLGTQACYQACIDNEPDRFRELFSKIFFASLNAYDATRKELEGYSVDSQLIFSSEPLEDLLVLSGYAKLYAELYENQGIWQICEGIWNAYLSTVDSPKAINFIAALVRYRDTVYAITPRAVIRTNWDLRFKGKLREMDLMSNSFDGYLRNSRNDKNIKHPSPLIRIMARGGDFLFVDARSIFVATYLRKHSGAADVDLKDRRDIAEQVEREILRAEKENAGENSDENSE